MKKQFLCMGILLGCVSVFSQSDRNKGVVVTPQQPVSSPAALENLPHADKQVRIQLGSCTGKLLQEQSNAGQKDGDFLVTTYAYDPWGRPVRVYEPFVTGEDLYSFIGGYEDLGAAFYEGTSKIVQNERPYSDFVYSGDALGILQESSSPGLVWSLGEGHTRRYGQRVSRETDSVLNLHYGEQLELQPRWVAEENGEESLSARFLSEGDYQGAVEWNPAHIEEQVLTYRGGTVLPSVTDRTLLRFHGLDPEGYYVLRLKAKKHPGTTGLMVSAKGDFNGSLNYLSLEDETDFSLPAYGLETSWLPFSSGVVHGCTQILLIGEGPTGTAGDVLFFSDVELYTLHGVSPDPFLQPGALLVETNTDENGNRVEVYSSGVGLKILERQWAADQRLDTYYVYDAFFRLRAVVPPQASLLLAEEDIPSGIEGLLFLYRYDGRGRVIETHTPGKGREQVVYDRSNQVVLTRDENLTAQDRWLYTKYDIQKRPVITGLYTPGDSSSREALQELLTESLFPCYERRDTTGTDLYTGQAFPHHNTRVLTRSYYDHYPPDLSYTNPDPFSFRTRGLLLAEHDRVLLSESQQGPFVQTRYYYDHKGRMIKLWHKGMDHMRYEKKITYHWWGDVLKEEVRYDLPQQEQITGVYEYTYARPGVLQKCDYTIGDQGKVILYRAEYNALGQRTRLSLFRDNAVSSNFLQNVDYSYNERGWLKRINNASLLIDEWNDDGDDVFGQELFYGEDLQGVHPYTGQYNGNVSAVKWKVKASGVDGALVRENVYTYTYDGFNRMERALYRSASLTQPHLFNQQQDHYNERVSYDAGGNITSLQRTWQGAVQDELELEYASLSPRTVRISENGVNTPSGLNLHFTGDNDLEQPYDYDGNGNLTRDGYKGLLLTYNHLNLLTRVKRTGDNGEPVLTYPGEGFDAKVRYVWTARGEKLRKRTPVEETVYFRGLEKDLRGNLSIDIPHGRVRRGTGSDSTGWFFDFYLTDHLGNVRAVVTNQGAQVRRRVLTMESSRSDVEEEDFYNVPGSRRERPVQMPQDNTYGVNTKVTELSASPGPGRMMAVKAGDRVEISARYWFEEIEEVPNGSLSVGEIVQGLVSSLLAGAAEVAPGHDALLQGYTDPGSGAYGALGGFIEDLLEEVRLDKPQAFMVYLTLDAQMNILGEPYSGMLQVEESNVLGTLGKEGLTMVQDGYFHVYLVNASARPVDFDDMSVKVIRANTLQLMNYYPFGLMWQHPDTTTTHRYWHHAKELQQGEFTQQGQSLHLEDFGARMYDPVIGRWWSVDPLAAGRAHLTPYHFVSNNPVSRIDPDGRWDDWVESANGDITWRNDVNANNHKDILKSGEIYRGTSYQREKIWTNVNVRGNSESGLMQENYKSNGKMEYTNLTPWVDKAFEELGVARFEGKASNPRIEEYLTHTQLKGADINDATSWCAGFVNWTLETGSEITGTGSALALSFRGSWGQNLKNPAYGSIATISYGGGKGHVGIVVGVNANGRILILGGNQGAAVTGGQNEVNISPNNISSFQYHYPKELTPYYDLPKLNINGKSINYGNTR